MSFQKIKRNLNTCLSFYCIIFILSRYMHCILFYLDTLYIIYIKEHKVMRIQTDKITVVQAWSFVLMADEGGGGQIYPQHFRKQKKQNNFTDTRYTDPMECTHGCILLFEKNVCTLQESEEACSLKISVNMIWRKKSGLLIWRNTPWLYGPETRQMTSIGGAALDTQWTYQLCFYYIPGT